MVALGLLMLVVAGIVALVTGLANSGSDHLVDNFSILGMSVDGSSGRIFLYGAVLGAVAMLGLNMLLAGIGRGFKNKVKAHRETKEQRHHEEELQHERDELAQKLESEQSTNDSAVDIREAAETNGRQHRFRERA